MPILNFHQFTQRKRIILKICVNIILNYNTLKINTQYNLYIVNVAQRESRNMYFEKMFYEIDSVGSYFLGKICLHGIVAPI